MLYPVSPKIIELKRRLEDFMDEHIYPNEERFYREAEELGPWMVFPIVEELKPLAKAKSLWNRSCRRANTARVLPISNMHRSAKSWAVRILLRKCSIARRPDTGNMEVLERYGSQADKERWLKPMLAGEIRSCFAMTEPAVASSDATNIESSIVRDGDHYVINGRKWYTTKATDARCKICIFMGKSDPDNPNRHIQQSMILVPMDTPGIKVLRPLPVFGFYGVPDRKSQR